MSDKNSEYQRYVRLHGAVNAALKEYKGSDEETEPPSDVVEMRERVCHSVSVIADDIRRLMIELRSGGKFGAVATTVISIKPEAEVLPKPKESPAPKRRGRPPKKKMAAKKS